MSANKNNIMRSFIALHEDLFFFCNYSQGYLNISEGFSPTFENIEVHEKASNLEAKIIKYLLDMS